MRYYIIQYIVIIKIYVIRYKIKLKELSSYLTTYNQMSYPILQNIITIEVYIIIQQKIKLNELSFTSEYHNNELDFIIMKENRSSNHDNSFDFIIFYFVVTIISMEALYILHSIFHYYCVNMVFMNAQLQNTNSQNLIIFIQRTKFLIYTIGNKYFSNFKLYEISSL